VTVSALYNAVFSVVDPMSDIPRNSGCYRPMRVIAPAGTVVNVKHPGPSVGGNTDLQPKLIDLLLKALSEAVPERVAASTGGSSSNLLFGGIHPDTGEYYSNYHLDGTGTGATLVKDGNDGEITRHSNCRNTPIEVFEHRYPLLTREYGLVPDSGGAGRHRGGLATTRTMVVLAPEMTFSALFDRHKIAPEGLAGGLEGGRSALLVKRAGEPEFRPFAEVFGRPSPTKFTNVVLNEGDEVRYVTPGGAGFGPPDERDPAALRADLEDGYVTTDAGRTNYGAELAARAGAT
jgi:N-methylhydantoinase B